MSGKHLSPFGLWGGDTSRADQSTMALFERVFTRRATPLVSGSLPIATTIRGPGCVFYTSGLGLPLSGTLVSEIEVPYGGTITLWTIVGDLAGSASIVVSHATYANYDTMTTLFTATCGTSKKAQSAAISFAITAGDILRFTGSGFLVFTRCSIVLTVT